MKTSYTKLIEAMTRKDWQTATERFTDIMEQKVAQRLAQEKRALHEGNIDPKLYNALHSWVESQGKPGSDTRTFAQVILNRYMAAPLNMYAIFSTPASAPAQGSTPAYRIPVKIAQVLRNEFSQRLESTKSHLGLSESRLREDFRYKSQRVPGSLDVAVIDTQTGKRVDFFTAASDKSDQWSAMVKANRVAADLNRKAAGVKENCGKVNEAMIGGYIFFKKEASDMASKIWDEAEKKAGPKADEDQIDALFGRMLKAKIKADPKLQKIFPGIVK